MIRGLSVLAAVVALAVSAAPVAAAAHEYGHVTHLRVGLVFSGDAYDNEMG